MHLLYLIDFYVLLFMLYAIVWSIDCEECNVCDCNYYDCKYFGYDESNHYIYENCEDYLIDYIYNKGKWCYLGHKCPIVFLCIVDAFVELHL